MRRRGQPARRAPGDSRRDADATRPRGSQPGRLWNRAGRRGGGRDRPLGPAHGRTHGSRRARARARGGRGPAPPGSARADPTEHEDLARAAGRGAAAQVGRGDLLPLRGPGLQRPRDQRADRQHRPRSDLDRRAPRAARWRADGDTPQRAGPGCRHQPARGRGRAPAARRRRRPRGATGTGGADHLRPRARSTGRRTRRAPHVRARRGRRAAGPRSAADHRHGADRPRLGEAAALVPAQPGAGQRRRVHRVRRIGRAHPGEPDHQPALGHVGVRHRLIGGAERPTTPCTASRLPITPRG